MKLANRAAGLLRKRRGETLVETVLSLLIFSIVMLAVTYMLTTSLRMITKAQETEAVLRERDNALAAGEYSGSSGTVTFTIPELSLSSSHGVIVGGEGGLTAFRPEETP